MSNVHKDFHGVLSFGLQFLEEHYGIDAVREFLSGLTETVYTAFVEDVRARGLAAIEDHWQTVFQLEGGDFDVRAEGDTLELRVNRCPAVTHLQEQGFLVAEHFCEHTRMVNEAVCAAAGFTAEVEYDQEAGRCVQRFRRAKT